jgi:hypothetical protein
MNDLAARPVIVTHEPSYPALSALARNVSGFAWGTSVLVCIAIAWAAEPALGWGALVLGLVAGGIVFALARLLGDIARLLVDTLIPK